MYNTYRTLWDWNIIIRILRQNNEVINYLYILFGKIWITSHGTKHLIRSYIRTKPVDYFDKVYKITWIFISWKRIVISLFFHLYQEKGIAYSLMHITLWVGKYVKPIYSLSDRIIGMMIWFALRIASILGRQKLIISTLFDSV